MLRRIHKRMPKQLASDEREREREPTTSQSEPIQHNQKKKKKKSIIHSQLPKQNP